MEPIAYLDGAFLPQGSAVLSPNDVGLLYGMGSFETLRLYAGRPFLAERHATRLASAIEELELEVPRFDLRGVMETLSEKNALREARGRVILTGGIEAPDGSTPRPRLYAEVGPLPPWAAPSPSEARPDRRTAGVIVVSNILGGITPVHGLKTLNYLPNYLARREARKRGAHEAILRNGAGELLEGATSNVFFVLSDALVTPPTDGRALPGVTRGAVIEEARRLGIPIRETPVLESDIPRATEAFLTSTIREILPIATFDAVRLDAPGPITRRLQEAYRERVRAFLAER